MPERPIVFRCRDVSLVGILHQPEQLARDSGVLIVVGGPQYRVGSHRQFVLLARYLAAEGIPVFRFDYRGMGDSAGEVTAFDAIDDDIAAAIDAFMQESPEIRRVVLWGLCDAATASALYVHATGDHRVVAQVAVNPWVFTPEGNAETYLKHYYGRRLLSRAFWRKVFSLKFDIIASGRGMIDKLQRASARDGPADASADSLPRRLCDAQLGFTGPVLLLLSGRDLTAKEYLRRVDQSPAWRAWRDSDHVEIKTLAPADHTFSRACWRDQVAVWTRDWLLANTPPRRD